MTDQPLFSPIKRYLICRRSGKTNGLLTQAGWFWLVGGGPGDPGLLTLHALNALRQADIIIYDALVDEHILQWANPQAEIEYAGKRGGKPSPLQRDISMRLIELARQGKRVLRLKGGDPFVFGRGEEAQTLVQSRDTDSHCTWHFCGHRRVGLCGHSCDSS